MEEELATLRLQHSQAEARLRQEHEQARQVWLVSEADLARERDCLAEQLATAHAEQARTAAAAAAEAGDLRAALGEARGSCQQLLAGDQSSYVRELQREAAAAQRATADVECRLEDTVAELEVLLPRHPPLWGRCILLWRLLTWIVPLPAPRTPAGATATIQPAGVGCRTGGCVLWLFCCHRCCDYQHGRRCRCHSGS